MRRNGLQLLRLIQSASSIWHLYPAGHPRRQQTVDELAACTASAAPDEELTLALVDDCVLIDGRPSPAPGTEELFNQLRRHGCDGLRIGAGAGPAEWETLLTSLCSSVGGLGPTPHIQPCTIRDEEPARKAIGPLTDVATTLARTWQTTFEERRLNVADVDDMVSTLGRTLETGAGAPPLLDAQAGSDYTMVHVTNVALLAMGVAQALGLPSARVRGIGAAALLHDIGRLNVPKEILTASGRLSEEQVAIMRRHPEDGARMLLATPGAPALAVAVAFEHHIQHDGGGYPRLPRGWRIDLASAITHVVDVYDALRTTRPYRPGLPPNRIAELMRGDAGTVFDPALLEVLLSRVVPTDSGTSAAA